MARVDLERPVLEVAPALLGARLSHAGVTVRLTEVEAYAGPDDPASHASRGRTPRTAAMFGPAGHLYVYLSHGLHWCANVVTGPDGTAAAVLLRAGEVVDGASTARERRGEQVPDRRLARGPGCLGQALALGRRHDGADLLGADPLGDGEPVLVVGEPPAPGRVSRGPRVGVPRAADRAWRFWLDGDPTVSSYRRHPRAPYSA